MKFKTFRALAISGVVLLGVGGSIAGYSACNKGEKEASASATAKAAEGPKSAQAAAPDKTAAPAATGAPTQAPASGNLRPMDRKVLDRVAQGIASDKVKDAIKGESYKVNLYKEADGKRRVKIDLDRDDKWDEKWTFEDDSGQEKVKRQVASKDDDNYDQEYRLEAGSWVVKN
jgi:hypothetical protein